jgi:zinc resistance-associated protein
MVKTVAAGLTALFVTASSLAYAQAPSATTTAGEENTRLSAADLNALTDARIGIVKAALQLTPEQAKYWPAVEEAIRNRAMGMQVRLAARRQRDQGDSDLADDLRHRADALAQRSAELKQLADAWQPLSATLTPEQKQRLRVFAVNILRLVPRAVDVRRMQNEGESDED